MFVALRDLRFARGRFVLVSAVIVLITVLVGFLSALTAGLGRESTSAVVDLPVDRIAFSVPDGAAPDFTATSVTTDQVRAWADTPGVASAEPLGVTTTRAQVGDHVSAVTVFGVAPGSTIVPVTAPSAGQVVLSEGAADDLGAQVGSQVEIAGRTLTVSATTPDSASFAHTPVVWTDLPDWQAVGGRPDMDASVVAIRTSGDIDTAAADARTHTTSLTPGDAKSAVSSFAAENGSLRTMQAFLLAISALVVGAFFAVWTIGRSEDIAVLKALGASTRYLLRDALGQALIVLVGGVAVGTAIAAGAAAALSGVVPVVVDLSTTLLPAVGLVVLGGIGAALAVVRITRVDPHVALAAR